MEAGYNECLKLLEKIKKNPLASEFMTPVLWKEWGLLDYPKIIKHPMDLGTVEEKLTGHQYKNVNEFAFDMRLIWKNCMTYNADGSDIYKCAKDISKEFEDGFAEIIKEIGVEDIPEVSLADKTKFTQDLYSFSSDQIGKIIQILDEKCPKSLIKSDPETIEILVDEIDSMTFHIINTYIQENIKK